MGCGTSGPKFDPDVMSIEHFDVQRVVGQGGYGKVNAAIRTATNEWFAIKKLLKVPVLANDGVAMIHNERNLLAFVDNPFMCNMYFAFQDKSACYLVLDLQLGGDLRYHMKLNYTEEQARFYVACITLALNYIHSVRILHRDVKPENCVMDSKGYPRLTDLGISVMCADGPELSSELKSGTKPYMAPEQLVGTRRHNHTADYWQLGICAHEFITGRRPHKTVPSSWCVELAKNGCQPRDDLPDDMRVQITEAYPVPRVPSSKKNIIKSKTERDASRNKLTTMSSPAKSFIGDMLQVGWWARLSAGAPDNIDRIKNHEWFADFDWAACESKTMVAPFVPDINKANCNTGNNDLADAFGASSDTTVGEPPESDQEKFVGYDYCTDLTGGTTSKVGQTPTREPNATR